MPPDKAADFYVYAFERNRIFTRLRTFERSATTIAVGGETSDTTARLTVSASDSATAALAEPLGVPSAAAVAAAVSVEPPLYAATDSSLATGPGPSAVAVGSDGRMYVANTASWSVSVINTATGQRIEFCVERARGRGDHRRWKWPEQ